jgi:Asp/Glu/hydantoin racemase
VQVPSVLALLPVDKKVGVLTYDGSRLGALHLESLGIDPRRVRIRGMPNDGHLRRVIQDGVKYDEIAMEREMVDEAEALVKSEEGAISAFVLECTQMPPYAEAIQRRVDVPVYDVYTMVQWFYSGLVRRRPAIWER